MYYSLAYILILFMTGCSALDNLSETDNSNKYKKNESEILDEDFFSNGMFVFSEAEEKINETEIKNENIDNFKVNEDEKIPLEKIEENIEIASNNTLEYIEPTEFIDTEYIKNINFSANSFDSLKLKLNDFLKQNGYKLIWDTSYDVSFENNVQYEGEDVLNILKSIANDLSKMGIDIHLNVYLKNKVVLVYSVRS